MPKVQSNRYYPTTDKLGSPRDIRSVFKQVLDQHYRLVDAFEAYKRDNPPKTAGANGTPPLGSGPADTMLLGLRVAPVDTSTLADGTKLTYVKAAGHFEFK